ncbi:ORF-116 [Agrotis segetum nucleopolyhedrovirus A]|uniref:ORF-116 n=1 Tax=Agrotis segetum nuclear polyhedrosis virus TaxID=1962501 RepID=Q287F6_NPVAS|nr:ORF-116 [Agrotis segetum nucleopolyhedrovirus A]AAZ38282.1 ORF-116 [Agrotis segetum nucleopolyhedrovirus A]
MSNPSGNGKGASKRRASSKSLFGLSKRKQPPKELIATPTNTGAESDDIFSDTEATIDDINITSPRQNETPENSGGETPAKVYSNYDPQASTDVTTMDVDVARASVVFVRPPALNQIGGMADNVRDIQLAINTIKLYMDALQNNIAPIKMTAKLYFTMLEQHTNKLAYKDIMFSILNNNTVNERNFHAASNMFYYYFVKLFDNILPIAHVIVNVNYTRNKTKISHSLTAFFNTCAHYVVSNIKQLFNVEQTNVNVPDEYYKVIEANQTTLTNLYNFRLNDLRSVAFIKHTPDNDVNAFDSVRADNPEERVINVPIQVMMNVPRLYFE